MFDQRKFSRSARALKGFEILWSICFVAALAPGVSLARSIYVDSEQGDDSADGRDPNSAWKSIGKVNAFVLSAGDSVFFKRNSRWNEGLAPIGSGSPDRPIKLETYGEGHRPVIDGKGSPGFKLVGQEGWMIGGIEFTNDADSKIDAVQIMCGEAKKVCRFLRIRDCVARDSGRSGFHIGDANAKEGVNRGGVFDDVVVEDCEAFGNLDSGIFLHGVYPIEKIRNVVIRGCVAHSNGWDGIKIYTCEQGLIENCVAYRNGAKHDARVGIWCWDAYEVVIQHCESYENVTPGKMDGGGFDIDWNCKRCTIQYCYSHDNDGAGILFMGVINGNTSDSQVRFNISQNDGRKNGYGGITCYGELINSEVYNNAVFNSAKGPGACLLFRGTETDGFPKRINVFNNIFVSSGERSIVVAPEQAIESHQMNHNCYHSQNKFRLQWANSNFDDLDLFRKATGLETDGMAVSPKLLDIGKATVGQRPMTSYQLSEDSPCRDAGSQWEESFGNFDFWGNRIQGKETLNIGPHQ